MKTFRSKSEIFTYIKKKFTKNSNLILIRGSTAKKPIKAFSDLDIEVYSTKLKKPNYEIAFLKEKPILITIYFYKYKIGKIIPTPENVKVLHGQYNLSIKPDFSKDNYTAKERIKRECQLLLDFLFKYLRTKDKKYLKPLEKRV